MAQNFKRLAAGLLAVILCASLATGCGSKEPNTSSDVSGNRPLTVERQHQTSRRRNRPVLTFQATNRAPPVPPAAARIKARWEPGEDNAGEGKPDNQYNKQNVQQQL